MVYMWALLSKRFNNKKWLEYSKNGYEYLVKHGKFYDENDTKNEMNGFFFFFNNYN